MRARFFIGLILVWQAVFAPAAMAMMSPVTGHAPAHAEPSQALQHTQASHHAGDTSTSTCCDLAGHCSPVGLPSVSLDCVHPFVGAIQRAGRAPVLRAGFRHNPYRPPSRLMV